MTRAILVLLLLAAPALADEGLVLRFNFVQVAPYME